MPSAYVATLAKKKGITNAKSEKRWKKAKQLASDQGHADEYDYITGIFKRMMGEDNVSSFKDLMVEEGEEGEPTNVSGQNDNPDLPLKKKKKKKEEVDDEDTNEEREPDQTNPKMNAKRNNKMRGDDPESEADDVKQKKPKKKKKPDANKTGDNQGDPVKEGRMNFTEFQEARKSKFDYEIMHGTHTEAVGQVLAKIAERGYEVSDDEVFNKISGIRKPGVGDTNSYHLTITKNGKEVKKRAVFQVYNRDNKARNVPKPYELNFYIS